MSPAAVVPVPTEKPRAFGEPVLAMLTWTGDLVLFCWRVARALVTPPFERAEFFRQLDAVGAKSLPLACLAGAATGVVLSLQTRDSLTRFGARSLLPAVIVYSLLKETGPIIASLIVCGRVGAGIGAELGSMRVTEQIDAMEASAVDPYKYLVATRILACIVAMPLLTVATDFVGVFMGWGGLHAGGTDAPEAVPFKRLQRRHFRRHSSADAKDRDLRTDHRFRRLFSGHADEWRDGRSGPLRHQFRGARVPFHHAGGHCSGAPDYRGVLMSPITVTGLSNSFGKQTVLDGITFRGPQVSGG